MLLEGTETLNILPWGTVCWWLPKNLFIWTLSCKVCVTKWVSFRKPEKINGKSQYIRLCVNISYYKHITQDQEEILDENVVLQTNSLPNLADKKCIISLKIFTWNENGKCLKS